MKRTVEPKLERYRAHRIWVRLETRLLEREGYSHDDALELAEKEADERIPACVRKRAGAVAVCAGIAAVLSLLAIAGLSVAALLTFDAGAVKLCYAAGVFFIAMTLLFLAVQPVPYLWFMTVREYEDYMAEKRREHDRAVLGKHRKGRA